MKVGDEYYYYQNDHLGTPQKMIAGNGEVVWSAKYNSFGEVEVELASTVENNLRFPGQFFDAETGLHYNLHRFYDPETGRYLRVDPIGFEGGDVTLYAYALNDPVNSFDPDGLFPEGFLDDPRLPDNFKNLDKDLQKALIDAYANEQSSKTGPQLINVYGSSDFGRPASEHEKCISDCLIKAVIGENPMSPIQGEAKTYVMEKAGEIALKKAVKKGIKTVVVKVGSKLVPGLGAISTIISVKQFASCAKKCSDCYNF